MINLKEFKQSVLQKAMQGKLTKQLPSDGNTSDLLVKIANKKRELYQEGKLKGHSKPLPPVTDKEIPSFKIPNNWEWTKLGNLVYILEVPTVPKYKYKVNGIPLYRIKDVVAINKGLKPNITAYIDKNEYLKNIKNKGKISINDLLITATGTLGSTCIIKNDRPLYFQGSNNIIWIKNCLNFNPHFLNIILQSPLLRKYIKDSSEGATIKHLSIKLLSNLPVPLPPLSEQKRIVDKVNKCFKLADTIQKERELNKEFAHDMKQSLLMEAMQGKLTKQLPSDGTADELLQKVQQKEQALIKAGKIRRHKKLPLISKDEIPSNFTIPKNWKWVRLGSLVSLNSGLSYKKKDLSRDSSDVRVIRGGNISNDGKLLLKDNDYRISNNAIKNNDVILKQGQLLTPVSTSPSHIAKMAIVPKLNSRIAAGGFVYQITPYIKSHVFSKFLLYDLTYIRIKKEILKITHLSGSALCNLPKTKFIKILLPLPPLAEQKRIIQKLKILL